MYPSSPCSYSPFHHFTISPFHHVNQVRPDEGVPGAHAGEDGVEEEGEGDHRGGGLGADGEDRGCPPGHSCAICQ